MTISKQDANAVIAWLKEQNWVNEEQKKLLKNKLQMRNYVLDRLETWAIITVKTLESIRTTYGI
jgi:hypothetical protein